jgi:hypothetical protein
MRFSSKLVVFAIFLLSEFTTGWIFYDRLVKQGQARNAYIVAGAIAAGAIIFGELWFNVMPIA